MTAYETVTEAVHAAGCSVRSWRAGSLTATCPAHDDRAPSLSVTEADDGKVLLTCRAGCRTDDVLAALGLGFRDLFDKPRDPSRPYVPRREPSPWDLLGDLEHVCDRILQYESALADPAYRERRAAEFDAAGRPDDAAAWRAGEVR